MNETVTCNVSKASLTRIDRVWVDIQELKALHLRAYNSYGPAVGEAIRYAEQYLQTLLAGLGDEALGSIDGVCYRRLPEPRGPEPTS